MSLPARDELPGAVASRDETFFRVWAPEARQVEVVFETGEHELPLGRGNQGYFGAAVRRCLHGALYKFRVDGRGP